MQNSVIVALLTPLDEEENIDVGSLERLLEWVLAEGAQGVFVGGTIGEGTALVERERVRLLHETAGIVGGRVPVLANVSESSTRRALELSSAAAESGVDAVVVTPRFGFPPRSGETLRHVEAIARSSKVPVWFYENPHTTGVTSTFEEIRELLALPNVVAFKYSAPDQKLLLRCAREIPNRPAYTGNVGDIAWAASEGIGAISGIGSLVPGLCVRTWRAGNEGRADEARRLQDAIAGIYEIYGGAGWPFWPAAQKHVLKRRGILRTSRCTSPFTRLTAENEAFIDAALEKMDLPLLGLA